MTAPRLGNDGSVQLTVRKGFAQGYDLATLGLVLANWTCHVSVAGALIDRLPAELREGVPT